MNRACRLTILVLGAILVLPTLHAFDLGYAKEDAGQAGAFLDFAASARSLGMGRAHSAVADDASAGYWNPAGLSQLDRKDLVTMYSALYENTGFGAFSYAQPTVDYGTMGIGFVSLRSGDYDKRNAAGDKQGSFSTAETAVMLSHGILLSNKLSVGTTLKAVSENVDSNSASGYGIDFGAMWKSNDHIQFGLVARNVLAPELKLKNVTDEYAREFRFGTKMQVLRRVMMAADVSKTGQRSAKLSFGGEWLTSPNVAFRFGINEAEVTAGLGVKLGPLGLDYAFGFQDAASGVQDLGGSHRVGFHLTFGGKVSDHEVSLKWQKKGQVYLVDLRNKMNEDDLVITDQLEKAVIGARQVIGRQGYLKPQDLYAAQGYISYFQGEYERSVQSLGEAAVLEPQNKELALHLSKARDQMTEERTREIVAYELKRLKEFYDAGNWRMSLKSCEKILSFRPDHTEALVYWDEAKAHIYEPIIREMKIGKTKFENRDYLDAIKCFQKVKELDPNNKEATQYMSHAIGALEKQSQVQANLQKNENRPVYEIERDTEKSRALYSQGLLLYSQGKLKEAVGVWSKAVKYDNTNALAGTAYNRAQLELEESLR